MLTCILTNIFSTTQGDKLEGKHTAKREGPRKQANTPLNPGVFPPAQTSDGLREHKFSGATSSRDTQCCDKDDKEDNMAKPADNLEGR